MHTNYFFMGYMKKQAELISSDAAIASISDTMTENRQLMRWQPFRQMSISSTTVRTYKRKWMFVCTDG